MALFRRKPRTQFIRSPASVAGSISFAWKPNGQITIKAERLRFPGAPIGPGLYRFRFEGPKDPKVYIGESKKISRRFSHYANPGPTQTTNIRLNAEMVKHLNAGGVIGVDTCAEVRFGQPKAKS